MNSAQNRTTSIPAKELSSLAYCPRNILQIKTALTASDRIRIEEGNNQHKLFEREVLKYEHTPISLCTLKPEKSTSSSAKVRVLYALIPLVLGIIYCLFGP